MLIEFGEAFDFTGADFVGWCTQVGFRETSAGFPSTRGTRLPI